MANHDHPPHYQGPTLLGPSTEGTGDSIGPYRLLERLGEGGFGVVWLAERRTPFVQRVALKVIKPGMDSRSVIARFDQERQALAVMDHHNVARVLDGGLTSPEQGSRPYFVMELVKGDPITDYCDRNRLSIRERLELFVNVCSAVQHAHHKGIIHRDIKPGNVLVTVSEGRPTPKVIDFGVAKAVSHTLTQHTIVTEHGQLIGTPEYMSPEQAEMGGTDVDTRTDVYSLGVLLYELLTGQLPFEPATLRAAAFDEVRRIIREQEPPKPSTRLTTLDGPNGAEVAARRQQHREELTRTLRRELDWIPLRAMRKDRARRYATPEALAEDIQRYLDDKPIDAAPESRAYLFKKFARRYKGALAAASAVVAALALGVVVSTGFWAKANLEAQLASDRLAELTKQRSAATAAVECFELLGKAQDECRVGTDTSDYPNFYRLMARLQDGALQDVPEVDILVRTMLAAASDLYGQPGDDWSDPIALMTGALATAETRFGERSPSAMRSRELLAQYYKKSEEISSLSMAQTLLQRQLAILRLNGGGESPDAVRYMTQIAQCDTTDNNAVWEPLYDAAIGLGEHIYPDDQNALIDSLESYQNKLSSVGLTTHSKEILEKRIRFLMDERCKDRVRGFNDLWKIAVAASASGQHGLASRVWGHALRVNTVAAESVQTDAALSKYYRYMEADIRRLLAGELLNQSRFEEAAGHLLAAWELVKSGEHYSVNNPPETDLRINVARSLGALFKAWDQAAPDSDRAERGRKWQTTATEYEARDRADRAELRAKTTAEDARRTEANALNTKAWNIVRFRSEQSLSMESLRQACDDARRAVELSQVANNMNTLGIAMFRIGQYDEAIEALMQSNAMYLKDGTGSQEADWAFIAMAHHRLGHAQQAADARQKYLELRMTDLSSGPDDEHSAWFDEVEQEFGVVK